MARTMMTMRMGLVRRVLAKLDRKHENRHRDGQDGSSKSSVLGNKGHHDLRLKIVG